MPQLKTSAATVSLEESDDAKHANTVLITVFSPADDGGQACETAAAGAMSVLKAKNALCRLEHCCYLPGPHLFAMKLYAMFVEKQEKQPPAKPFAVKLGIAPLTYVTSFQAGQEIVDPTVTPQKNALWLFRIEELIPPGGSEQNTPAEPFSITVNCKNGTETYADCHLTSVSREDHGKGLVLIRKGTAASRSFINIL